MKKNYICIILKLHSHINYLILTLALCESFVLAVI